MIWVKTDAGRAEMQSRALVKERAQRNLLLVIDGAKSQATLLENLAGITADDFGRLEALGLIEPLASGGRSAGASRPAPAPAASMPVAPSASSPAAAEPPAEGVDYAGFTSTLTGLISKELGLRGFMLTLAVEKASTVAELRAVADRVLAQIAERRGEAAASSARRALYGD